MVRQGLQIAAARLAGGARLGLMIIALRVLSLRRAPVGSPISQTARACTRGRAKMEERARSRRLSGVSIPSEGSSRSRARLSCLRQASPLSTACRPTLETPSQAETTFGCLEGRRLTEACRTVCSAAMQSIEPRYGDSGNRAGVALLPSRGTHTLQHPSPGEMA